MDKKTYLFVPIESGLIKFVNSKNCDGIFAGCAAHCTEYKNDDHCWNCILDVSQQHIAENPYDYKFFFNKR